MHCIVKKPSWSAVTFLVAATLLTFVKCAQVIPPACVDGQYFKGGTTCTICNPGQYCPDKTAYFPSFCNRGYYSDYGATACTICPAGWKCLTSSPTTAFERTFTGPSSFQPRPVPCPKGTYSEAGETVCHNCPIGTYCDSQGLLNICEQGTFCDATMMTKPKQCSAGSYCKDGKAEIACPSGLPAYYSNPGAAVCTLCPAGAFCQRSNHPAVDCPDGTYNPQVGRNDLSACLLCDAGFKCPNKNKPPVRCEHGEFSLLGDPECQTCPEGYFCADPAQLPELCPAGRTTLSSGGATKCFRCPPGYSCANQDNAIPCDDGFYSLADELECHRCPNGYSCVDKGALPRKCLPGQFAVHSTNWEVGAIGMDCKPCPTNYKCVSADVLPQQCPGQSKAPEGSQECTAPLPGFTNNGYQCPDGKMTNQHRDNCIDCPAGYSCNARDFELIVVCPTGYWSPAGQSYCTPNPIGKFTHNPAQAPVDVATGYYADVAFQVQMPCPEGFSCGTDKSGRTRTACGPGRYFKTSTQECTPCERGHYCPPVLEGLRAQGGIPCPTGYYADLLGMTKCLECPPGWKCDANGPIEKCPNTQYQLGGNYACTDCPAMHECNFGETIVPCPAFHYANEGDGDCKPCGNGYECFYAKTIGTNDFVQQKCERGYYSSPLDYACKRCPRGNYCPDNASGPTPCGKGKYAAEGQSTCTPCQNGYYAEEKSEFCSPLPAGFYALYVDGVFDEYKICPQGTYSRLGQADCSDCEDGFVCPAGTGEPFKWANSCPLGSWCKVDASGEFHVNKCPRGTYGTKERATSVNDCEECPPGYACEEGSESYLLYVCPQGSYCPDGQAISCGAGFHTLGVRSKAESDCIPCAAGQYCPDGATSWEICPKAFVCPLATAPIPCPAGTYSRETGKVHIDQCERCPAGSYCPLGHGDPIPAPVGFYSSITGLSSVDTLWKCPPGFYCGSPGTANQRLFRCDPGHYCPEGSTAPDDFPCPKGTFSDRRDLFDEDHCNVCSAGYYCPEGATSSDVVICPAGSYCPPGTTNLDIPKCPPGYYSETTGAQSIWSCAGVLPGKMSTWGETSETGGSKCPDGYYCPRGTGYWTEGALATNNAIPCPAGTFSDITGLWTTTFGPGHIQECSPCGLGHFCPETKMTLPTECPDGFFNDFDVFATHCKECPAGYYCFYDDMDNAAPTTQWQPIPCSEGEYSAKGADECSFCPVGTYCPWVGTTEIEMIQNICPEGSFCNQATGVARAEPGLYEWTYENVGLRHWPDTDNTCLGNGLDCSSGCPPGFFCPAGAQEPQKIPKGMAYLQFGLGIEISSLQKVPPGVTQSWYNFDYTDTDGEQVYGGFEMCPPGQVCYEGAEEPMLCPPGTFRQNIGGQEYDDCTNCQAGWYCPNYGMSFNSLLPANNPNPKNDWDGKDFFNTYDDLLSDALSVINYPCPAGNYCPEGARIPIPCPIGTYNPDPNGVKIEQCIECDVGFYCPCEGQDAVDPTHICDDGFDCYVGASRPEPIDGLDGNQCPLNHWCIDGTTTVCDDGYATTFMGAMQESWCIQCKPGYECYGGEMSCCSAGWLCLNDDIADLGDVTVATNWQYQMVAGDGYDGYYAPEGACLIDIPYACPVGYYTGTNPVTTTDTSFEYCSPCEAGFLCELVASDGNTDCPKGFYCPSQTWFDSDGSRYRKIPCPHGTYRDVTNGESVEDCIACLPGFACDQVGIDQSGLVMVACAAGFWCAEGAKTRYPEVTNEGLYGPCPPGYWCPAGSSDPYANPCLAGTFSPQWRATDAGYCIACPPGYNCVDTGLTEPGPVCEAGNYCDGASSTSCTVAGTFCPTGAFTPLYCPFGMENTRAHTHCVNCPAGVFCMWGVATECPVGYYCK